MARNTHFRIRETCSTLIDISFNRIRIIYANEILLLLGIWTWSSFSYNVNSSTHHAGMYVWELEEKDTLRPYGSLNSVHLSEVIYFCSPIWRVFSLKNARSNYVINSKSSGRLYKAQMPRTLWQPLPREALVKWEATCVRVKADQCLIPHTGSAHKQFSTALKSSNFWKKT